MLKKGRHTTICMAVLFTAMLVFVPAQAQEDRTALRRYFVHDTITIPNTIKEKSDVFYDSLKNRHYNNWVSRTFAQWVIVARRTDDYTTPTTSLESSHRYFGEFANLTISKINIIQANVFEDLNPDKESKVEKFLNSLHRLTSEKQLRQNLLFKEGEKLNPYNMAINEKLIRNLPFIATAFFVIVQDKDNPGSVTVNIFARDNWSISGGVEYSGAQSVEALDKNLLGTGNQLTLKYYLKDEYQSHGFETSYAINNLWGTFANVELTGGVGSLNNTLMITADRPFILPNDHFFGFTAGYQQRFNAMLTVDTTLLINKRAYGLWYGYSFNIDRNQGTNMYVTTGYDYQAFKERPDVSDKLNPFYIDRSTFLVSLGFARQNFLQGNMIYGYGRTEDIPYGYRFDLTSGLEWAEVSGRRKYISLLATWGDMTKFGYFNFEASAAAFWDTNNVPSQGVIKSKIRYFSPLFNIRSSFIRQFVNIELTSGYDRYQGERELLEFRDFASVRGMSIQKENMGTNRFVMNTETVLFAPVFFYHFRFAFNAWGDMGWLGNHRNVFKNPLYSAIGVGVRIRNERLIFNSLSIRFGYALNVPPYARYNNFQFGTEQFLNMNGFVPTAPKILPYD